MRQSPKKEDINDCSDNFDISMAVLYFDNHIFLCSDKSFRCDSVLTQLSNSWGDINTVLCLFWQRYFVVTQAHTANMALPKVSAGH